MPIINTSDTTDTTSFINAVINNIPTNGLWMFDTIQSLPINFFNENLDTSYSEISFKIIKHLLKNEPYNDLLTNDVLKHIIHKSFNFDILLKSLDHTNHILECFHGPTLTFKDFGCRFLANLIQVINPNKNNIVLVATSGDTGSAVADAFHTIPNYKVVILYPKNKVSMIQQLQMTTYGDNIIPIAMLDGTFDDCQIFIKSILRDNDLKNSPTIHFISSNSVNLARLIPQITYYVYAYIQLLKYNTTHSLSNQKLLISVPSGNCGNITGCLISKQLGVPVDIIIAAQNSNNTFVNWIHTDTFTPKKSILTIANAMDVGNPSNFKRIFYMYPTPPKHLKGYVITEKNILETIHDVFISYNYIIDTHTAVAYCSKEFFINQAKHTYQSIVVSTSHPIKFIDNISHSIPNIKQHLSIPKKIEYLQSKEKDIIEINNNYNLFKQTIQILFNSPNSKKPNILLIGFPGCGKTTISNYIHEMYDMNTINIDTILEINHNMNLFNLIKKHGEEKFKKIEEITILHSLERSNKTIISPGGSVIYYPKVFEFCKQNNILVIFLKTNLHTLLERTDQFTNRGIVGLDNIPSFYKKRSSLYTKYANIIVNCDNHSIKYIGDLIYNRLL